MALFQYPPLEGDEIRLLILSSRSSGPLRISIKTEQLSSSHRPQYEALSYVWGSEESPCKIPVEDPRKHDGLQCQPKESRSGFGPSHGIDSCRVSKQETHRLCTTVSIPATANLAQALPYLQSETEERVLWIDAICINQGNIAERGQQVGRMADIYKMANRVLIWLGPADCHTKLAIETLACLAAEVEVNFVTTEVSQATNAGPMSFLSFHEAKGRSLLSMFERPWFQRLWIWQEAQANPDETIALVGEYSIPWSAIRKFFISLHLRPHDLDVELASSIEPARKLSHALFNADLLNLLLAVRGSQCADARDRVFALLGMLEPHHRLDIKPDYTKTVTDVFKQVVLRYISVFSRLNVLRHCTLVPEIADIPSWVPNWSEGSDYWVLNARASLSAAAVAEYDGEGTLRVLAVEVGTIASIQKPGYLAKDGSDLSAWADFFSRILSLESASETAAGLSSSIEVVVHTLCRDKFADSFEPPRLDLYSNSEVKESLLKRGKYLAKGELHSNTCEQPLVSLTDLSFQAHVQTIAAEYSPIRTMKGQLGLGPRFAAPGDKVCVILGCDTPLVLRFVSENQWCIVGDCYVHEIMDGSALRSSLPGNFQVIERMNPRTGLYHMAFKNTRTSHIQIEDPRITEPLPSGWELAEHEDEGISQLFVNRDQSWYTWADPRLNPDALRARGVKLKTFDLV